MAGRLKTLDSRIKESIGTRIKVVSPGSWRSGMTSSQRGYDYKWQKAREQYLRDNPLCVYCERSGRTTAASVVDHIVAHRGDMILFWDQANWQSLCKPCHDSVKQAEEAAGLDG
ncbi:HNH endonuclease [Pseudomonas sp. GD03651]|uniref:HNH endonuclease n=1 Tax=Pseudomonas TaxID=286 RepID=UPI00034F2152|nr:MULTISPECIES: HNH endonuclease [Pseudomonas]AGN78495.1 HNH endonuclease [Pseudomonas putida H8234]MDH2186387.1 HNH endonuclease [Pseudomonas sp. GD03651]HDS1815306.1 HNH endonuclease [Pseudomonas putida]HDS3812487.1 HNH endonuclease [Pseudomonas putida]